MSRPRILIPVPTSFDEAYNAQSWPEYASAVSAAGGEAVPVQLTHTSAELEEMATAAHGILLPGSGADVDPARYGHDRDEASAEPDVPRELIDFVFIDAAERFKKPLLCICFGTQNLNVRHGGTLIQDLNPLPVNHRAGRAVQVAHTVVFPADSRLGGILMASGEATVDDDAFARVPANSSHHQAIDIPGEELRVVARCPGDGVIEAVEGVDPHHWLVGVQWHPERTVNISAGSRFLFSAFLAAAGA